MAAWWSSFESWVVMVLGLERCLEFISPIERQHHDNPPTDLAVYSVWQFRPRCAVILLKDLPDPS